MANASTNRIKVTDEMIIKCFELKDSHNQHEIAKVVHLSQSMVSKILRAEKLEDILMPKQSECFTWKDFNNSII